jgi:hypothetical protein
MPCEEIDNLLGRFGVVLNNENVAECPCHNFAFPLLFDHCKVAQLENPKTDLSVRK